jgi:hypothetical protein
VADWYAADYIDKLDEIKTNIDERMVVTQNAAAALGRKTDEMIVTALDSTTNTQTEAGTARLTTTKINAEFVRFGESDIPDDGNRFWAVSPDQWTDLLGITAFSSADYVGPDQLPYKAGMAAKVWMTFMWWQFSGLPETTNIRKTFAYHRNCVGHAIGADVSSEINYVPEKVAHLATSSQLSTCRSSDAIRCLQSMMSGHLRNRTRVALPSIVCRLLPITSPRYGLQR